MHSVRLHAAAAAQRGGVARRSRAAESGHALLAALIATAMLLPLGAFAVMQARLDFLLQHHTRAAAESLAVAESGLAHALADLATEPRFERLLSGPDQRPGNADDGQYPFRSAPPEFFPAAPYRYEVRVAGLTSDRAEIVARGFGRLGAMRAVVAAVERSPFSHLPGALASAAPAVDLLLARDWRIEGSPAAEVPAMAVRSEAVAAQLRDRLTAEEGARLTGPGGRPSLIPAGIPDVGALLEQARRRGEAQSLRAEVDGAVGDGLFVRNGSLHLLNASGSGILLIDGALEITGSCEFHGVILVAGDLRVAPDAEVAIAGAVVQGAGGGALVLRGRGRIGYDAEVVERVGAAHPGLLPARARVTGWRELPDAQG
ncbi:MAG: hypothetical protein AB7V27_19075 [Candidatus Binatia bacterium]